MCRSVADALEMVWRESCRLVVAKVAMILARELPNAVPKFLTDVRSRALTCKNNASAPSNVPCVHVVVVRNCGQNAALLTVMDTDESAQLAKLFYRADSHAQARDYLHAPSSQPYGDPWLG